MSYLTGIGWDYEKDDIFKDFMSRRIQRESRGTISPNNLFARGVDMRYRRKY
ncbi:MAG: hypothetical protein ABH804_02345 [archaeon]